MSSPLPALRSATLWAALLAAAPALPAQASPVALHHNFPLAGGTLVVVADGLQPGEDVRVALLDAVNAPLSLVEELTASTSRQFRSPLPGPAVEAGTIQGLWRADERGRIVITVALDDPADADRPVSLAVWPSAAAEGAALQLHVQPPTLVLATAAGHARLSLLDGRLLSPSIPAAGGLRGISFSADGARGYVLRDGGLLQVLAAANWGATPLSALAFDAAADVLAGGPAGAAFLLSRPGGQPFAAPGRALFLDQAALALEPLAQPVDGRRVALSADGLTAFVAEDDLVVREVDVATRAARALLPVGLAGDQAVADLALDGRRLLVATRGAAGRPGALSTLDLDTGWLSTLRLAVQPARLVALGDGRVLVVPSAEGPAELLQDGVPLGRVPVSGRLLDGAPVAGGALLLAAWPDGARSLSFLPPGSLRGQALTLAVPAASRLAAPPAGLQGVVALLGDPSGAVHIWQPRGELTAVPGLLADPAAPFFIAP